MKKSALKNGYQAKLIAVLGAHGWSNNRIAKAIGGTSSSEIRKALLGERPLGGERQRRLELLVLGQGLGKVVPAARWGGHLKGQHKADPARARELKDRGYSVAEIAEDLAVTKKTVYNYLAQSAVTD